MHREGSEGERIKCYLSKKMKRGECERGEAGRQGEGWLGFIPTRRAEYRLLHSLSELCCYLNLAICIALFIHRSAHVDNQSNLPPRRETEFCLRDACLSPSDLRNAASLQTHQSRTSICQSCRLRTCLHRNSSCCS